MGKQFWQSCLPENAFVSLKGSIFLKKRTFLSKVRLINWYMVITKTYLYDFYPLKPHFYIVKLGFTVVILFLLFLLINIDCGYSLEPPRRGGSNEYPRSMLLAEIWKISEFFIWKNCHFLVVKCLMYLNRSVFVMINTIIKCGTSQPVEF